MKLLRFFTLGVLDVFLNMSIALGLTFGFLILVRPVTNRLLRPKYRVSLWTAGWYVSIGSVFYEMVGRIYLLPVTFRGWITPGRTEGGVFPQYIPGNLTQPGEYDIALPGGEGFSFSVGEEMLNLLAVLTGVGFLTVILLAGWQEHKVRSLCRQGEPMSREWLLAHGMDEGGIEVRILPNLPASFVCRMGMGKHTICLQKELPEDRMDLVLRHELAHIRRRHVWAKGLATTILYIHWWNPVLWLAYRLTCRDIELSCDELVLGELDQTQRREYARMLVELGSGKHLWGGLTCFGECDAAIRVRYAVHWKAEHPNCSAFLWPLMLLVFLFLFTSPREEWVDRDVAWANYVQGPNLVLDMRERLDDPDLEVKQNWMRDENLMVQTTEGDWYLCAYGWNSRSQHFFLAACHHIETPNLDQYREVRAWDVDG